MLTEMTLSWVGWLAVVLATYPPSSTIPLRHYLFDGATQRVDKTVECSIVRESDGYFWSGSAWQAAEVQVTMSQVDKTSVHWIGIYQYDFVADANEGFYDWQSTFTDTDDWISTARGTIEVRANIATALAAYDGPTNTEMLAGFAALNDPTAANIADAIWDEGVAGHLASGTTGRHVYDVYNDTNEMQAKLPAGTISNFDETTDPVELLNAGGSAGTSADELVDDTWNELVTSHTITNSTGDELGDLGALAVSDIASIKSTVENSNAIVGNATYGNAQLVRSATPANELIVDSNGLANSNVIRINSSTNVTTDIYKMFSGVAGAQVRMDSLRILNPAGDAVTITGAGASASAVSLNGNSTDTTPVVEVLSGAVAGQKAMFIAGATYGPGLHITGKPALNVVSTGDNPGLIIIGSDNGAAIWLSGGDLAEYDLEFSGGSGVIDADIDGTISSVTNAVTTDAASRTASKADVSNLDVAVSTRSSHSAADVTGGTTVAAAETNIRGADPGTDTLDTLSDQIDILGGAPANIAEAVWNAYLSTHTTVGTFGKAVADVELDATDILADTAEMQGKLPSGTLTDATSATAACASALNTYDPPTFTEMDADHATLSTHSAADVWAVGARTITGGVANTCESNTDMVTYSLIGDAVWDEFEVGHTTDGTYGDSFTDIKGDLAAVLADTDEMQGALPTGNLVDASDVITACTAALNSYDPPTKAELDSAVAPLSTHSAAAVWGAASRGLTEAVTVNANNDKTGYSISGTKTTLDALNDVSAATVQSECEDALIAKNVDDLYAFWTDVTEDDLGVWQFTANALEETPSASCASQASVDDVPTLGELNARTLPSADYFNSTDDVVAHVTLSDTCTTNTDMRGTDSASTHAASDVWSVATRGLTGTVTTDSASREASKADVSGLSTYQQVFDLGCSTHSAAAVWGVATREVTGGTIDTNLGERGTDGAAEAGDPMTLTGAAVTSIRSGLATAALVLALNDLDSTDVITACTSSLNTYDPPTKAELDALVAPLSTHDAADVVTALLATTIDGETYESTIEALRAVLYGKTSLTGSTVTFYKDDGSSPKVDVTYGATAGVRTTVVIYE